MRRPAAAALMLAGLASCIGPRAAQTVQGLPPEPARATLPPAPARFAFEGALRQGGVAIGTAPAGVIAVTLDDEPVALAPDRRFLIAFDRDAGPSARVNGAYADGRAIGEMLAIAPGAWRIERVNAPLRAGRTSAEFAAVRPGELARIGAARARDTGAGGWRQTFLWPVTGRISGLFGAQRVYQGVPSSFHSGVDVAAPTGTPIAAPADGVVILTTARPFTLEGNLVIIDHGMGLNSAFLHLSRIDVREGQRLARGQLIGAVGATGRATGPHMHWGMKWRGARIDPLLLAGPMGGGG